MHEAIVRQPDVESHGRQVSLPALEPDAVKAARPDRTRGKGGDGLKAFPMGKDDRPSKWCVLHGTNFGDELEVYTE